MKKLTITITLTSLIGYILLNLYKTESFEDSINTESVEINTTPPQTKHTTKTKKSLLKDPELFRAMEMITLTTSRAPADKKNSSSSEENDHRRIENFEENIDSMTKNEIFAEYASCNIKLTESLKLLEMLDDEEANNEARESLMNDIEIQKRKIELLDDHIRPSSNIE